jgi:hypothetical protein
LTQLDIEKVPKKVVSLEQGVLREAGSVQHSKKIKSEQAGTRDMFWE